MMAAKPKPVALKSKLSVFACSPASLKLFGPLYSHDNCAAGFFAAASLLQLVLAPLQADLHDTAVSRALNPLNCLTALTSCW
jgi:hypothetical protein